MKYLIPIIENKQYSIPYFQIEASSEIPKELVLPFKSYMFLFPRFCSFFHKENIDIEISESGTKIHFVFTIDQVEGKDKLIKFRKILKQFISILRHQYPIPILKKLGEPIIDTQTFHKLSQLIEEGIRHFNKLVYLEYQFDTILELPQAKKKEVASDYHGVVDFLKDQKGQSLKNENKELRNLIQKVESQLKAVENEKKRLSKNIEQIVEKYINNDFSQAELYELFRKNKLQKIFQIFSLNNDNNLKKDVCFIENQYSELNEKFHLGLIESGFYFERLAKIKTAILSIISGM